MSSDVLFAAAHLLLPEVLVKHFDLIKYYIKGEEIHFYFTESNRVPEEFKDDNLHSKGFFPEATVQDFPIRGKNVFLHITRRRWLNKATEKVVGYHGSISATHFGRCMPVISVQTVPFFLKH